MKNSHQQGPVDLVREEDFPHYLRERLQGDSPPLSPQTLRQLRNARKAALDEAQGPTHMYLWKPLAASAAALLLSLIYFDDLQRPAPGDDFPAEAELLFAEEDLQLYEELDFYHWLATNEL